MMWKCKIQKTTALSTAGRVLYCFNCEKRGPVPLQAPRAYGIRPSVAHAGLPRQDGVHRVSNNVIGGRERAKHIDIQKHFAHEVIQNCEMLLVCVPMASQLMGIFTKGLHYQQWQVCVEGILGWTFTPS